MAKSQGRLVREFPRISESEQREGENVYRAVCVKEQKWQVSVREGESRKAGRPSRGFDLVCKALSRAVAGLDRALSAITGVVL